MLSHETIETKTSAAPRLAGRRTRVAIFAFLAAMIATCAAADAVKPVKPAVQSPGANAGGGETFSPAVVVRALKAAYPDRVTSIRGSGMDWNLVIDGTSFEWLEGKLLPSAQVDVRVSWTAQPFYSYPKIETDIGAFTDDQLRAVELRLSERSAHGPKRSSAFFDALWKIHGKGSAWEMQKRVRFVGFSLTVHRDIVAALSRVEAKILALKKNDSGLSDFLGGIKSFDGFVWRDIEGTESRSNHAYGIAIDIVPRAYHGKSSYWLWSAKKSEPWYKAAWLNRWKPPQVMIDAFESEGFIWGGKWLYFDTLHFEYRPEILLLNGLGLVRAVPSGATVF